MTKTAEQLRDEAARLQAEAAQRRAELLAMEQQRLREQAEREREFDRRLVAAGYDSQHYDRQVDSARQKLREVVAKDPVTKAIAAVMAAETERRDAFAEYVAAEGRLGRDISDVRYPQVIGVNDVAGLVRQIAEAIADEQAGRRRSEFHARRTEAT